MDRNDCRFVGRIGDRIKEGVTINGDAYMYFDLELEARANATSTDNNYHQNIPIMLFRKPVIDYLKRLKVRRGTLVVVFGFVSTYTDEIKGITLKNNGINAYEVYVVKTKAD